MHASGYNFQSLQLFCVVIYIIICVLYRMRTRLKPFVNAQEKYPIYRYGARALLFWNVYMYWFVYMIIIYSGYWNFTFHQAIDICRCLPPNRTWHKVNDPKVDYSEDLLEPRL